jgi:hypothetical protein
MKTVNSDLTSDSVTAESLAKKPGRLRWKKHERETGLRAIGAGPRGSDYTDGVTKYATVYAHSHRHTGKRGWWWTARVNGGFINHSDLEGLDEATAKQQAQEYVKAQLGKASHD